MVHAAFEPPFAWWLTRERIGQDLREHYAVPQEMSPRLLACIRNLSAGAPSLLSKLDAIEGNQLLRACRTRLRVLGLFP